MQSRKYVYLITIYILIFFNSWPSAFAESAETDWSISTYFGKWTDTRIGEIIQGQTDIENSNIWVAGLSRDLYEFEKVLKLESEINLALHSGKQSHGELNSACLLRYKNFPWNHFIDTSLAYGLGLSYAFQRPEIEKGDDNSASRWHIFMPLEMSFSPPRQQGSSWELFVRVHHRSGAFGFFSDADGSNFLTGGLRYRF